MKGISYLYELELSGLDGSNLVGFLAAIGTLRSVSLAAPKRRFSLKWSKAHAWIAVLCSTEPLSQENVLNLLTDQLAKAEDSPHLKRLGDDLSVAPDIFRGFAADAATAARPHDRVWADFAAAFGCEALYDGDKIQDTAFRTMRGAGHQHFLASMRAISASAKEQHLHKTLFEQWRYDDPVERLTLRWDPNDDVRYALRWRNPSGDPARKRRGNMIGANRLAIEGLPLFPTAPRGGRLCTTGFRGTKSNDAFVTWPIWECPLSVDVIRTLLAYAELQREEPNREVLTRIGVTEVFRSQRISVGKMRNFTPARSVGLEPD
jgi:hypothetical protein